MARDLSGQRFGWLQAIKATDQRQNESVMWQCTCNCGNEIHLSARTLAKKTTKPRNCGCMNRKADLTGQKFGRLTVLAATELRKGRSVVWNCICDCGNEVQITTHSLRRTSGNAQSCGCLRLDRLVAALKKDLTGRRFGRLIVISETREINRGGVVWNCKCDCGNHCRIIARSLMSGNTQSCGCLQKERQYNAVSLPQGEAAFNSIIKSYRASARKNGIAYDLTKDQFRELVTANCFYCGSSPSRVRTHSCFNGVFVYNGIDQIRPGGGYTIDNCTPCCKTCNIAKHTMTQDEFTKWILRVYYYFAY